MDADRARSRVELFDLESDPDEQVNLAGDPCGPGAARLHRVRNTTRRVALTAIHGRHTGETVLLQPATPLVLGDPDAVAAKELQRIAETLAGRSRGLLGRQLSVTPVKH